jgi:hypothetical protein
MRLPSFLLCLLSSQEEDKTEDMILLVQSTDPTM